MEARFACTVGCHEVHRSSILSSSQHCCPTELTERTLSTLASRDLRVADKVKASSSCLRLALAPMTNRFNESASALETRMRLTGSEDLTVDSMRAIASDFCKFSKATLLSRRAIHAALCRSLQLTKRALTDDSSEMMDLCLRISKRRATRGLRWQGCAPLPCLHLSI